jgi:hypothetical protein
MLDSDGIGGGGNHNLISTTGRDRQKSQKGAIGLDLDRDAIYPEFGGTGTSGSKDKGGIPHR